MVVVLLVVGGGSATSTSTLAMVPADTPVALLLNVQAIREHQDDFPGDFDDFEEELQETIEDNFGTEEIDLLQVNDYLVVGYDFETNLLKGNFRFGDIRDDWEDRGFEKDSYKGYELWDGDDNYALLEEEGAVIRTRGEDDIKDVIKIIDGGSGSLADSEDSDLKRLLDKLGSSPAVIAIAGDDICGDAVSGCRGMGVAYSGGDVDREEISTNLVVLFSNERRAERAAEEYDDIAEVMEELLAELADSAEEYGVFDAAAVDVDDILNDGEFAIGTGIIDVESE